MPHEDLEWARERVTNMAAHALIDANIYGTKLLKGFGYPDEVFSRAQDYRALTIVLEELSAVRASVPSQAAVVGSTDCLSQSPDNFAPSVPNGADSGAYPEEHLAVRIQHDLNTFDQIHPEGIDADRVALIRETLVKDK